MSTSAAPARPAEPARSEAGGARRDALLLGALFAGALVISGCTILRGIDPFDEGLALQAAHRVAAGQIPYRDFLWAYGPGVPYVLGGLRELFGASLLDWRILRVLVDAGVAVTAFWLVRRETGNRPLALCGWLLAACAMAGQRSANPFSYALLLALLGFAVATSGPGVRRAAAAGVLMGLAGAFRIDFMLYGLGAALAATALRPGPGRPRDLLACAGSALAVALVAYAPFLIAIGPADLYDALIGTSLREGSYWTLPFPLAWHGGLGGPHAWKDLLDFYVPLLLVVGSAAALVAVGLRWRATGRVPWVAAGLLVLGAGCGLYLRSRTDPFHTQPLAVVLAILLPVAILAARRVRPLAVTLAAVLALLLAQALADRVSAVARGSETATLHLPAADGVETTPADARTLEATVGLVDRLVPAGRPIYVLPRRSDLVRISDPLLYVLADRPNPTPRDHGLLTGAAAQASIVAALERVRPGAIVRWTDPISSQREPNKRGRSSGVHTLDAWVAAHYRLRQRAGRYDVLVPR